MQHEVVKPDKIAGHRDVQYRALAISQDTAAEDKAAVNKDDRRLGIGKLHDGLIPARKPHRFLQKGMAQPIAGPQYIISNGSGVPWPFR
jgi:hypothetical protein